MHNPIKGLTAVRGPMGFACPHYKEMKEIIAKKIGPGIKIIDWTH